MKKHLIFDLDGTVFDPHVLKRAYPEAREVITNLTHEHTLSLLTAGKSFSQWDKLMQCGLMGHFKTIMIVSEPENKREGLLSLMSTYPTLTPNLTIVIGDRVDVEIALANEFGCTSVWIKRGKYEVRIPTTRIQVPKHTISSLVQLPKIVSDIV